MQFVLMFLMLLATTSAISQEGRISVSREKVLAKNGETSDITVRLYPLQPEKDHRVFRQSLPQTAGKHVRLHFVIKQLPKNIDWKVELRGADGKVWSRQVTRDENVDGDFWTDDVLGAVNIKVEATTADGSLKLEVDKLALSVTLSRPTSITPPDDRVKFNNGPGITKEIVELSKAVARLRFVGDDGNEYLCTAFLVSKDLMLTNNHCVKTAAELKSALADFDYLEGKSPTVSSFKELVITDTSLDYSLLRLRTPSSYTPLQLGADPSDNDDLVIIEHPAGEVKQASIIDCKVAGQSLPGVSGPDSDFGHRCDTLGGSSGSPVMRGGKVVGLHHLGFDPSSRTIVNRAVKINRIAADLKAKAAQAAAQIGIP